VNDDLNPRFDYGLTNTDNRHAFTSGANWDAWRGLGLGATFRYYYIRTKQDEIVAHLTALNGLRARGGMS
jgi:hypothetical protein